MELKKNIVRKQEMDIKNHELYSFMHDIFGPDVIEIFDVNQEQMERIIQQRKNAKNSV